MLARTVSELSLARRLRTAFLGYLRQDVQGRRAAWNAALVELQTVQQALRRLRRELRQCEHRAAVEAIADAGPLLERLGIELGAVGPRALLQGFLLWLGTAATLLLCLR